MNRQTLDSLRERLGRERSDLVKAIKKSLARHPGGPEASKMLTRPWDLEGYPFGRPGDKLLGFVESRVVIEDQAGKRIEKSMHKLGTEDLIKLFITVDDKLSRSDGWREVPTYANVTLDSTFTDYCRWESASRAETARIMAEWLETLERVDAKILNQSYCEVSFRMTLRQAFETGWTFDSSDGCSARYLASLLEGEYADEGEAHVTPTDHPLVKRVEKLWDDYLAAKEKTEKEPTAAGA